MKSKVQQSLDNVKATNTISGSNLITQKPVKPPIQLSEKYKKQNADLAKQKLDNSQVQDKTVKQIKTISSSQAATPKLILEKNQISETTVEKKQFNRTNTSVDGSKSHRTSISGSTQLSMLKKSSASVYGSEAGIKPITKNPWAPIKNSDDKKPVQGLKNSKSNTIIRSQSPQNSKGLIKGVQNNSSSLQSKSKPNQKESSQQQNQLQTRKLVTQGVNFGAFQSICSKYIENQYNNSSQKEGGVDDLNTFKKISKLSTQLQNNQRRKVQKEMELLNMQYELFLSNDSLKNKIDLVQRLNNYLQNSSNLNSQYDSMSEVREENGNYVRINFEGRQIFLEIIKSQISHSVQIPDVKEKQKSNPEQKCESNKLLDKRKEQKSELCLWNTPQNMFKLDNQIDQIDKIESLLEYIDHSTQDLKAQYEELLENQKYL